LSHLLPCTVAAATAGLGDRDCIRVLDLGYVTHLYDEEQFLQSSGQASLISDIRSHGSLVGKIGGFIEPAFWASFTPVLVGEDTGRFQEMF
jgi:hypothetical protein